MHNQLNSLSPSNSPLFTAIFIVITLHVLLVGMGKLWEPALPNPKPRSKVIVQTIHLKPLQSSPVQHPVLIASVPPTATIPTPSAIQPVKEDTPLPIKTEVQREEEPMPSPLPAASAPAILPAPLTPPVPAKIEVKPPEPKLPSPTKPALQEAQKNKQTAPVKKTTEPTKKTTPTTTKPKPLKEEKTQQKEQSAKNAEQEKAETEKKKQQEKAAADKKRQQEKAEAEKKQQKEKAEAEKKRQQEIAAAQEVARQKEQALFAKAKETLSKASETRDKLNRSSLINLETTALPKEVGSLQVDALPVGKMGSTGDWSSQEVSYSDEIAYRLKMALKLPDYGEVKIKLTLDRTGKVVKVETVQSESAKNKSYVENKIPTLLFPSFGQRFQGSVQNTFIINLQNDS